MKISEYANRFFGQIFPNSIYCIMCDSIIDGSRKYSLCDNCAEKFLWIKEKTCEKCGKILEEGYMFEICHDCKEYKHYFDKGFTCARYGLYERTLIAEFKKGKKSYIARVLGDVLYDRIVIENLDVDVIISIPMYFKKKKERGFNQSELMGKFLGKRLEIPFEHRMIERRKNTVPMKKLGMWERRKNMENAFAIDARYMEYLKGKNILVIDDIYTTGATIDACSKLLKESGAKRVYALTFAAGGN